MEKSCGTIIIKDNKVLLIKQNNGVIGFPKGHIEKNETEIQTALRETKEETNLDVVIDKNKRYEIQYMMGNGIEKVVVLFLATPINDDLKKQECEISKIEWVEKEDVITVLTYENLKEMWKKVLKEIQ